MKQLSALIISSTLLGAAPALSESAVVSPNGSRPSTIGAAEYFTGSVVVEPLFVPNETTSNSGGHVTFAPGARSAWHTHPGGQVLIVTDGAGWVQEEGGERRDIKPGDVVWTPPGVKHWHGATASTAMRHIAITNMVDGKNVSWMEQVTDDQYLAGPEQESAGQEK